MRIPRSMRWRTDRELDEEIEAHLELDIQAHIEQGLTREQARSAALRRFGNRTHVTERAREGDPFFQISALWTDITSVARSLLKRPGLAACVVGSLALGIGANTMMFSIVNAVLLRSLPLPDADRVVAVWLTSSAQPGLKTGTNALGYFTVRDHNQVFESVGAVRLNAAFNVGEDSPGAGGRIRVPAQWLTHGLIKVLGVSPAIGRWPTPKDTNVVVISHGLWQQLFGGSPGVLGKTLRIDAFGPTVIGVMPPNFELIDPAAFWLVQTDEELATNLRGPNRIYSLVARLKPGVTATEAQAEMTRLAAVLAEEMPETHRGWSLQVEALRDIYAGEIRTPLLVLQGAVVFVLLIACANVAGLLLAQASTRHKELALRAALGASRWHIVRQLLTESVLLAVFGGALGVALSWAGLRVFASVGARGLPASTTVTTDMTVLGFTLVVSIGSGVVFGVLPALHLSRPDLMTMFQESRTTTSGPSRQAFRNAFVIVQVSLALVLLIGAGLMVNSFLRLGTVKAGFDALNLLTFQVPFPRSFYTWDGNTSYEVQLGPKLDRESELIRERVATLPGVESATVTVTPPLGGEPLRLSFTPEGRVLTSSEQDAWSAEWYPVGTQYFRALRIPLLNGRDFVADDTDAGRQVAIVSAAMAKQFWPMETPIGKRIRLNLPYDAPREIVGVVGDVRQNQYQRDPAPQLYVPRAQLPRRMHMILGQQVMLVNTFIVRVKGDPASVTPLLRGAVADVDPTQVIVNVKTIEQYAAGQLTGLREYATILTCFSLVSVALAVVGIYAVVAHFVDQRRKEIGIRMALGARAGAVKRLVLRQGMLTIGTGIVLGTGASLVLTRAIESLLWGVTPTDPLTFILVVTLVTSIGLLACYLPARRASRIDPLVALKDP